MPQQVSSRDVLIDKFGSAFGDLNPPSDEQLLHPDCCDDVDILEFYGGIRWQDLTDKEIVYGYAAPTSFSPKAFRYYLPAYACWTLRNLDSKEYASESFLLALDPGTEHEMLHQFRKSKFDEISAAEAKLIQQFLWYVSDHPNLGEFADNALANYWMEHGEDLQCPA
ncbi:MAG: DUF6714 family protein [Rhizobiaceae bacterium]